MKQAAAEEIAVTKQAAAEEIAVMKQVATEEIAAENAPATKETGASLAGCEEWCIPHNDSWLVKCGWMKCAQCPQCVMRSKLKPQQLVVVAPGQVPATAEPVVVANGATQLAATEISIMGTAWVAPRLPKPSSSFTALDGWRGHTKMPPNHWLPRSATDFASVYSHPKLPWSFEEDNGWR